MLGAALELLGAGAALELLPEEDPPPQAERVSTAAAATESTVMEVCFASFIGKSPSSSSISRLADVSQQVRWMFQPGWVDFPENFSQRLHQAFSLGATKYC